MTYVVKDGWIDGKLPGPGDKMYAVTKRESRRAGGQSYVPLASPRAVVLHTTEGSSVDGAWTTLNAKFSAPHFIVGEDRIMQMRPLTAQAATLRDNGGPFHPNSIGWQIESVGFSKQTPHLLSPATLRPLAAVAAFATDELDVPLRRPEGWQDNLGDIKTVLASDNTRRRTRIAATFRGWVGHLEVPDQSPTWHWDPGAFGYAEFFGLVNDILGGDEDAMFQEWKAGLDAHAAGKRLNEDWPGMKKQGWRDREQVLREAIKRVKADLASSGGA